VQTEKTRNSSAQRTLERANSELEHANATLQAEVSERTRLEGALREADRRKDEFLAVLAHELRNPLAPILNAVQVIGMKPRKTRTCAGATTSSRDRSSTSPVSSTTARRRADHAGQFKLQTEPFDLATVLAHAVETSRPAIEAASQDLVVETRERPSGSSQTPRASRRSCPTCSQRGQVRRTGRPHPALRRRGSGAGRQRPRDRRARRRHGIGVSAEMLPQIFEPFMQGAGSQARSNGGLGIGLALVKRIAELHGGTVEAASEGPGRGSEFVVRSRRAARAGPVRPPCESSSTAAASGWILVVDDNPASAKTMTMLLRKMGHEVATSYDGEEAVETALRFRPDLAFLDIGLPKLDGYEARAGSAAAGGAGGHARRGDGLGQEDDRRRSKKPGSTNT